MFSNYKISPPLLRKNYKIQKFVSSQLKLLETEQLAVSKQERLESKVLGEKLEVEVYDIKKTSDRRLILHLKQRKNRKKAPNFKIGEAVSLDDPGFYSEFVVGIIKEGVKIF